LDDFTKIVLFYVVLLVSLVVHEASHALFALLGGDRTAYVGGQVTLNPIPHIRREPFGTVILPIALLIMSNGRWCMGFAHAPYDPVWAYKHPRRAALMAAAGPMANVLLAVLAFTALELMMVSGVAEKLPLLQTFTEPLAPVDGSTSGMVMAGIRIAATFLFLNIVLAILNLIPLPPFDGASIVEGLFPKQTSGLFNLIRGQFLLSIVALIAIWNLLPKLFYPVIIWVVRDAL